MATLTDTSPRPLAVPSFGLAVGVVALITVVRLIAMRFSVVDLFYDESQYWAWSREPALQIDGNPCKAKRRDRLVIRRLGWRLPRRWINCHQHPNQNEPSEIADPPHR